MHLLRVKIAMLISVILIETGYIAFLQINIKDKVLADSKKRTYYEKLEKKIQADMQCFPIMKQYCNEITFEDDYGNSRTNGAHEGCDLMYTKNVAGAIPVISATDGVIKNIGWIYLGGYRIGILSDSGIYYYYAHFDSFFPGLHVGKKVKAGEFLGFMGNSGEGEEGTVGKFPVHLHFGIYIEDENGNEKAFNPYPFLSKINKE